MDTLGEPNWCDMAPEWVYMYYDCHQMITEPFLKTPQGLSGSR